ncbi:unnamed protein product [Paramecium octaurelia]|uniref:Rad60/SUMO-like domain-containing protein n=1 Tax=Paramecium octaurelia TaxID=43137 RepID=A0A8S1X5M4_PAROT|nr:unnamed protein product [Paramecium octaurelia]
MSIKEIPIILVCKQKEKTYNVQVNIESSIEDLIIELHPLLQPGNQQQIVLHFGNMILNSKKQFKDYNIVKGSIIDIIIYTHGGIFLN